VNGLDETIHLSAYDPQWPELYSAEALRISSILPDADIAIEHIGSTAVPGLVAKPIIDIMAGIKEQPYVAGIRAALVTLGYEDMGEAGVACRIYFRSREEQAFNVALVERGGRYWTANLALREFLRANPNAAREYAEMKRAAFERGIRSLLAYSDHKSAFMAKMIQEAFDSKQSQ
jgi:GrpB-like predicted nucleotidyltransferase (UPF0157 family)